MEGTAGCEGVDGQGLEAGAPGLGPLAHEHEVEVGPLPTGQLEHRALATLILHRDELLDRRAVLDLDENLQMRSAVRPEADDEVGGEVFTPDAQGQVRRAERVAATARAPEDRLHQCLGDTALGLEKVHDLSPPYKSGTDTARTR